MNIEELIIYKVNVAEIATGCRIEGVVFESHMFLNFDKAMDFAFNLAREYSLYSGKKPIYYSKNDTNNKDTNNKKIMD